MVSTTQWLAFTFPLNMTGQPSPHRYQPALRADGLPVGMQIIGGHLADATVLRASAAFEAAQPWRHVQPPVVAKPYRKSGRRNLTFVVAASMSDP